MAQLVFEFVSDDLTALVGAVERVMDPCLCRCEVAYNFLDYERCDNFDSAVSELRTGRAISLVLRPDTKPIRYALMNEPRFNETKLPGWFGTIEYTEFDCSPVWNQFLKEKGLRVACLGFEEGVELDEMQQLTPEEFPWRSEWLVVGAVRNSAGEWQIQHGSGYGFKHFPPAYLPDR
jgi:hypothetical protein